MTKEENVTRKILKAVPSMHPDVAAYIAQAFCEWDGKQDIHDLVWSNYQNGSEEDIQKIIEALF